MKGYLLLCALLFPLLIAPAAVQACEKLQAKVDRYTALKRQGGTAKQMNNWSAQRRIYSERYHDCLRAQPRIEHTTGSSQRMATAKVDRQRFRSSNSDNPITQKLLTTCNFWIDTYNGNPSADAKSQRDTACRALDDAEQSPPESSSQPTVKRSTKECMKPGNLLDAEVYECMLGKREPDWR